MFFLRLKILRYSYRISQLLSFASTMITSESNSLGLPDFPITNLHDIVKIMVSPCFSLDFLISCVFFYSFLIFIQFSIQYSDT